MHLQIYLSRLETVSISLTGESNTQLFSSTEFWGTTNAMTDIHDCGCKSCTWMFYSQISALLTELACAIWINLNCL